MSEQGYSSFADGCNVCPNKGWDGDKPVRYAIVPRGNLMCCERCGGSYGEVPKPTGCGCGAECQDKRDGCRYRRAHGMEVQQ